MWVVAPVRTEVPSAKNTADRGARHTKNREENFLTAFSSGWRDLNPRPLEKGIQFVGTLRVLRVFGGIAMFSPSSFFPSAPDETPVIPWVKILFKMR